MRISLPILICLLCTSLCSHGQGRFRRNIPSHFSIHSSAGLGKARTTFQNENSRVSPIPVMRYAIGLRYSLTFATQFALETGISYGTLAFGNRLISEFNQDTDKTFFMNDHGFLVLPVHLAFRRRISDKTFIYFSAGASLLRVNSYDDEIEMADEFPHFGYLRYRTGNAVDSRSLNYTYEGAIGIYYDVSNKALLRIGIEANIPARANVATGYFGVVGINPLGDLRHYLGGYEFRGTTVSIVIGYCFAKNLRKGPLHRLPRRVDRDD